MSLCSADEGCSSSSTRRNIISSSKTTRLNPQLRELVPSLGQSLIFCDAGVVREGTGLPSQSYLNLGHATYFADPQTRISTGCLLSFARSHERDCLARNLVLSTLLMRFDNQHGTRSTVKTTIMGKQRILYEHELNHMWLGYSCLELSMQVKVDL